MSNSNEDYLDSLLNSVSQQVPENSALGKLHVTEENLEADSTEEVSASEIDLDALLNSLDNEGLNEVSTFGTLSDNAEDYSREEIEKLISEEFGDNRVAESSDEVSMPINELLGDVSIDDSEAVSEAAIDDLLGGIEIESQIESSDVTGVSSNSDSAIEELLSGLSLNEEENKADHEPIFGTNSDNNTVSDSGNLRAAEIDALFAQAEAFAEKEDKKAEENDVTEQNETSLDEISLSEDTTSVDDLLAGLLDESNVDKEASDNNSSQISSADDLSALSQDDIEKLISDAQNNSEAENEEQSFDVSEMDELDSLLNNLANNENFSDDDMLDLLNVAAEKQEEVEREEEETRKEKAEKKKKNKKEKKDKKKKKEKINSNEEISGSIDDIDKLLEAESEAKKESVVSKVFAFMTETDEEEATTDNGQGFEGVPGENQEILKELDSEGEEDKKKKKKGKRDKKAKKGKGDADVGEGEESEEPIPEKGKKKPKKEKKPKGEKKPFFDAPDNNRRLSKKNVRAIWILCATILVGILLVVYFIPPLITKEAAREDFYKGNYESTYQTFYGEKLDESDELLFNRSEILLKIQHKYDSYISYCNINMLPEALDQLVQAVYHYEEWLALAEEYGVSSEYNKIYNDILDTLKLDFNLDESEVWMLINIEDDFEYTMRIQSIANKTAYIDYTAPLPGLYEPPTEEVREPEIPDYEDLLPEEIN